VIEEVGTPIWTNVVVRIGDLKPWDHNPRQIKRPQLERLAGSIKKFGFADPLLIGPDMEVYNGHQRLDYFKAKYGLEYRADARQSDRKLTEHERQEFTILIHEGATGEWDFETLGNLFDPQDLINWGMPRIKIGMAFEDYDTSGGGAGYNAETRLEIHCGEDQVEEIIEFLGTLDGVKWKKR